MGQEPAKPDADQLSLFDDIDPDQGVDDSPRDLEHEATLLKAIEAIKAVDDSGISLAIAGTIRELESKLAELRANMDAKRRRRANASTKQIGPLAVYRHSRNNAWAIRIMQPNVVWVGSFREDANRYHVDRHGMAPRASDVADYVARRLAKLIESGVITVNETPKVATVSCHNCGLNFPAPAPITFGMIHCPHCSARMICDMDGQIRGTQPGTPANDIDGKSVEGIDGKRHEDEFRENL